MPTTDQHRADIRDQLAQLVHHTVAATDPHAFHTRTPRPSAPDTCTTEPTPLAAVAALRRIARHLHDAERDAIGAARSQGHHWTAIAYALGPDLADSARRVAMPLATAAWHYATYRTMPDQTLAPAVGALDAFGWRCGTCHALITETDPDNGPEAEHGHNTDCPRDPANR